MTITQEDLLGKELVSNDLPILQQMKALYKSAPNVKTRYVEGEGFVSSVVNINIY
jgi:hypothetical protein